jgi:hypothetical protein
VCNGVTFYPQHLQRLISYAKLDIYVYVYIKRQKETTFGRFGVPDVQPLTTEYANQNERHEYLLRGMLGYCFVFVFFYFFVYI